MHSHGNKELSVQKLRAHLEQIQKDTNLKQNDLDSNTQEMQVGCSVEC